MRLFSCIGFGLLAMTALTLAEDRTPRAWLSSPQKPPYAKYSGYASNLAEDDADVFFKALSNTTETPLDSVSIFDTVISDRGGESLGKCKFPKMTLGDCQITQAAMESILGCKHLRMLDVGNAAYGNTLGLEKVDFANLSAEGSQLTYLAIVKSRLDDASLMTLAPRQPVFELELQNSRLKGPGLAVLKKIPKLVRLKIGRNPIDDEGLAHLPPTPHLNYLSLDDTKITDAALKKLTPMPELIHLNLSGTAVTGEGLAVFSQSPKLIELTLSGTKISDDDVPKLPISNVLLSLDLRRTPITDVGLNRLTIPATLEYLLVESDQLSSDVMLALSQKHPKLFIHLFNPPLKGIGFRNGVRSTVN